MKLDKLKKHFENFLLWEKEEIEENENAISELMENLKNKRKNLEKKIKKENNKEEKNDLEEKLKAVKNLIRKAKKSLY